MTSPGEHDDWPGAVLDTSRPNIARVYDYLLGGKDNYAADREEAERLLRVYPLLPRLARENRLFLRRAVTWLARQGIRQFLDIGSGLPTASNTHEAAQEADRSCRVVYADNDRVVVAHARALLAGTGVVAIEADLAEPARLLADPAVDELIRPGEPTALVLAMVLHFFPAETAQKIVAELTGWLAPGSFVVISVGSGDEETGGTLAREYTAGDLYNHQPAEVAGWFEGLDLVPPGLTDARDWQPGMPPGLPRRHRGGRILAGVARKPRRMSRPRDNDRDRALMETLDSEDQQVTALMRGLAEQYEKDAALIARIEEAPGLRALLARHKPSPDPQP